MKLSVIIPTRDRPCILNWTLKELLYKQSLKRELYEVIVVDDNPQEDSLLNQKILSNEGVIFVRAGGVGPAKARNLGASRATGEILVFIGDDCLPSKHFLWRHLYDHKKEGPIIRAIQGYTRWHPDIPPDDFMNFLTGEGGLQANWFALKETNGSWKSEAPSWFMTTNCSVSRETFEDENGFSEIFPSPAWEDIELGIRFVKRGVKTLFSPDTLNYHYHKLTLRGFVERQKMEGRSRLFLAQLHPEMSPNLIDPAGLRSLASLSLEELILAAEETHFSKSEDIQLIRKTRWGNALRAASLIGLNESIQTRGGCWRALPHVHTETLVRHVCGAAGAIERGDPTYALIESEWARKEHPDNWALHAMDGEVKLSNGMTQEALLSFTRAAELGPSEKWVSERLDYIKGIRILS